MRVFTRYGMQGVWLWVLLRALQCVLQGYITKCLPFSGISKARLGVGWISVGNFMCLLHGLRDMCMISLGLSALNECGSGVIDILIGSVCHIGWCIVGRPTLWWEGMLVLNLRINGAACTSQIFAYPS